MRFDGFDEEGNYNPGCDWLTWLLAVLILAMGIALCMITRGF